MKRIAFALILLTFLLPAAAHEQRGLQPSDFYNEVTPSDAAVSPDGSLVAFTVMTIVEKENKRHREIWMQRLSGGLPDGDPFRFTTPTESASSPVWSPDGTVLSFQSRRGKDENATWFIRVTAPGGEAYHVEGVGGAPMWSPDGRWIAFTKRPEDDDGDSSEDDVPSPPTQAPKERDGWIAPDAITSTLDPKRFDGRVITSMRYKSDGTLPLLPHPSARGKTQLFVVPAGGGEAKQLTSLTYNVRDVVWTAVSDTLLFVGDELEDDEYNDDYTSEIYAISRHGGQPRNVTDQLGSERAPAVSPDGKKIAYLFTPERGAPTNLMVADIAFDGCIISEPRSLTEDWDLSPGAPAWTPSGRALRFDAQIGGNRHLFEASVEGGGVRQVTQGDRTLSGFSASKDGSVMAFASSDALAPAELAVARADGSGEKRFTHFNDGWLTGLRLVPPERLAWRVADGTEVEGWLVKPAGFDPDNEYPMILKIHGGPHSAYGNVWFRTFHILSSSGFFVLYPNPRGSSGYGHDFMYATRGQWGEMDSEDFLAGVDAALAAYPQIDPKRIGVSGGSYGGFMTAWLTATTDRFAAANPSRMIVNWESWYGTSDAQGLTEYEFSGEPWEARELYRKLSPLNYVENVTAPTLIIHSENDHRTPIADAEQWYMALKKRQIPVELVRYPRSSHGLSRTGEPWLLVDRLERIQSWFTHWLIEIPEKQRGD